MTHQKKPKKIVINGAEYRKLLRRLTRIIQASGFEPKQIVCIARGGLIPGDILSRAFKAPLAVISVASYPDGKTRQEKIMFSRELTSARPLERENILLVDDLTQTGVTLKMTRDWLCMWYRLDPAEVKTATIWHKACSDFKPDFYAKFVTRDRTTGKCPWIEQPQETFGRSLRLRPPTRVGET